MLELLFNNKHTEQILFYLHIHQRCYALKLATHFETSVYGFQSTLQKLERAGILVSFLEGKTRFFEFNPRYPFLNELQQFVAKAFLYLPIDIGVQYQLVPDRRRPRRSGKPL